MPLVKEMLENSTETISKETEDIQRRWEKLKEKHTVTLMFWEFWLSNFKNINTRRNLQYFQVYFRIDPESIELFRNITKVDG